MLHAFIDNIRNAFTLIITVKLNTPTKIHRRSVSFYIGLYPFMHNEHKAQRCYFHPVFKINIHP